MPRGFARRGEEAVGKHFMYGVPPDLPALRDFHGSVLVAADDLDNIVYFRFAYPGTEDEIEICIGRVDE